MILLDEYRPLAAHPKLPSRSGVVKKRAISLHQNRVWNFLQNPSGRMSSDALQVVEIASGSITFTYKSASGRAEWLSRDPMGSPTLLMPENPVNRSKLVGVFARDIAEGHDRRITEVEMLPEGPNLYSYVANNPINLIDPLGLWYINIGLGGGLGVGAGGGVYIGSNGFHPCVGGGLATLGVTGYCRWSPGTVSPGWGGTIEGSIGLSGAVSTNQNGWEVGAGWLPGASAFWGYTW